MEVNRGKVRSPSAAETHSAHNQSTVKIVAILVGYLLAPWLGSVNVMFFFMRTQEISQPAQWPHQAFAGWVTASSAFLNNDVPLAKAKHVLQLTERGFRE